MSRFPSLSRSRPPGRPRTLTSGQDRASSRCLLALLVGAVLLLAAAPARAQDAGAQDAGAQDAGAQDAGERQALALLERAARAGDALTYSGRQTDSTTQTYDGTQPDGTQPDGTQPDGPQSEGSPQPGGRAQVDAGANGAPVHHDPAHGATVRSDRPLAATAALDPRLPLLVAAAYDLAVTGSATCTGRAAQVVTATRADGSVAGRFWVDRSSGLLLRREVLDATGTRVRSSALVDLAVSPRTGPAAGVEPAGLLAPAATARTAVLPRASTLAALRTDGWTVPPTLPGGLRLYDTALSTPRAGQQVLRLSYSDGLSTLSLFAQRGRLGSAAMAGFDAETVGSRPVWVRHEAPERVVWAGGGRVWTLVSDAPAAVVHDVVSALPRDRAPQDGLRARLVRGLVRLGELLNPFS